MPSRQADFLLNQIERAKEQNEEAIEILRNIVRRSADAAPTEDLIKIAQFLYDLRIEAERN